MSSSASAHNISLPHPPISDPTRFLPCPTAMPPDGYLGTTHKYFTLSDYEIDPSCRYRKRIFHEGVPSHSRTKDECVRQPHPPELLDLIIRCSSRGADTKYVPRLAEHVQLKEHVQKDVQRKRRRESSAEASGYATDGSYAEVPPMSPFSPTGSVYDGIEDIDDQSDDSGLSDRDRAHSSTPGRYDAKGKEPMLQTMLPIAVRSLPKISPVSPKLTTVPSVSSSITQYSNSRLAERARIASLSAGTQSPVTDHGNTSPGTTSSSSYSSYSYPVIRDTAEAHKGRSPPVYTGEHHTDTSLAGRARRATITGAATNTHVHLDARAAKPEPAEESVSARSRQSDEPRRTTITPESEKVKLECTSPPPLDVNAPERPYAALRVPDLDRNTLSAPPEAEFMRSRKRSKSSASGSRENEPLTAPPEGLDLSQLRRRGDRGTPNPVLKMALESGDYIQVSENGFYCRVHGDHLGGTRSVTRHHESVHLNIMVECQYCNAQFSRRDAVLRHQRQSSCKTNAKWKVGTS